MNSRGSDSSTYLFAICIDWYTAAAAEEEEEEEEGTFWAYGEADMYGC